MDCSCAGIIVAPHGVQGHVKVKCFLEDPRHLKDYSPFEDAQGKEMYRIEKILSITADMATVALEGVANRTEAEALRGTKLMLPRDRLPALPDDTFYHADLIGLQVLFSSKQPAGCVQGMYNFGAGDIIEIQTLDGKCEMIPFAHFTVPTIDLAAGTLTLSEHGDSLLQGGPDGA